MDLSKRQRGTIPHRAGSTWEWLQNQYTPRARTFACVWLCENDIGVCQSRPGAAAYSTTS